ncbi:MAG: hypothetical protein R3328_00260 [Planococcaceae bacterium]|nr:hypothetical protein [Planococcaceae bacterium]
MAKKKPIKVVCKDCGKDAPIDFEKSNSNWTVHASKCDECGGDTGFKL